jgi:hypothetical protein
VQAQKYFLGDLVGRLAVVQKTVGDAKYHRPVLAHQLGEVARPFGRWRRIVHRSIAAYFTELSTCVRRKLSFTIETEIFRI